jgi:hypothetical protein
MISVCLYVFVSSLNNFWMAEPVFMKIGRYIMELKTNSAAYFTNPSRQSINICTPTVARQRLSKNVPAATNTHATIEDLWDPSFSLLSVSYQEKAGDYFLPELHVNNMRKGF